MPVRLKEYDRLLKILGALNRPVLALSGGVDSSFLCHALTASGAEGACAVTLKSDFFPESEIERARMAARSSGIEHYLIDITGLHYELIGSNDPDRCYFCKRGIFAEIKAFAERRGLKDILDGTNADDSDELRPGMKALREMEIISPLKDAGFTKALIRKAARSLGIAAADIPSSSCLATRFPCGERPDREKVKKVAMAEEYLRAKGIGQLRVRIHGRLARIEVSAGQMSLFCDDSFTEVVVSYLKSLGFEYITLDLQGFRSGSMDLHIKQDKKNGQR